MHRYQKKMVCFSKIIFILLCLLLFPLLCTAAPMPREVQEQGHSVKLGDEVKNHLQFFTWPMRITPDGFNYCWRSYKNYTSPEFILRTKKDNKVVWCIEVDRIPGITTPQGIGIGSTMEAIEEQYGKASTYIARNGDLIMAYGGRNKSDYYMRFRLRGRKAKTVVYMTIGDPMTGEAVKKRK